MLEGGKGQKLRTFEKNCENGERSLNSLAHIDKDAAVTGVRLVASLVHHSIV